MLPDFLSAPPLSSFRLVETGDPEELRRALFAAYPSARSFEVLDGDRRLSAHCNDCALTNSGISYAHYEAAVRFQFDATHEVRWRLCLSGRGETRLGSVLLPMSPQASCTIPPDAPSELNFAEGYRQMVVRFCLETLTRKLVAWTGVSPAQPVEFAPTISSDGPNDERLRRTVFFLANELELAPAGSVPGLAEIEQLMMLNFLFASRHNHRPLLERDAPDAAPWHVRRAEEFILANLQEPLTIEAIANATDVGARTLFKSFQKARGYSPMAFAKMRRLERARAMLQAPDATTTVTGVALLCGFLNQGHFARDYRQRFGELPSTTLKASR